MGKVEVMCVINFPTCRDVSTQRNECTVHDYVLMPASLEVLSCFAISEMPRRVAGESYKEGRL